MGTLPTYDGKVPFKANSADKTYIFTGWTPLVAEVNGITYRFAQIIQVKFLV